MDSGLSAPDEGADMAHCLTHGRLLSRSPCKRCGTFLCIECVWSSKFQEVCAPCYQLVTKFEALRILRPMELRSELANHINLSIGAGLFLGTALQLLLSSKFGYFFALMVYLSSLLIAPVAVMALFPLRWLWVVVSNPGRLRQVARFEERCLGLVRETLLGARARSEDPRATECLICQSDLPLAEGLCPICFAKLVKLIHEFGLTAPVSISGPPWTPPTRRNLLVLVVWTQVLSVTFFLLPGPFVLLCLEWAKISMTVLVLLSGVIFTVFGDVSALMDSDRVEPDQSNKPAPAPGFVEAWRSRAAN
jgi:hypothetical protein